MKTHIRIIGDCHGTIARRGVGRSYHNLIAATEYSVQLGDLGYPSRLLPNFHELMEKVDKTRHVVNLGNHDDYNNRVQNALGDFGIHSFPLKDGTFEFFYMRGAYSPDRVRRLIGVNWWPEEQLTDEQGWEVVDLWKKTRPSIVITHDCPEVILHMFYGGSCKIDRTNRILQTCFEIHRPKIWIFGHHHRTWKEVYNDTTFICLNGETSSSQMGYIDFDNQGQLMGGPQ